MLKFIKGHLTSIGGVEYYPIIALLIFMAIFCGAIYISVRAKKQYLNEMSSLPLADDATPATNDSSSFS